MTARLHPDIRWPDGRAIVTDRTFPNDIERSNAPDWTWTVDDYDLGDPSCNGYFVTEQDALDDARRAIADAAEDGRCEFCGEIVTEDSECRCAEVDRKIADALELGDQ